MKNKRVQKGKVGAPPVPVTTIEYSRPPGDYLLREAEAEPRREEWGEYAEAIRVLREKGFSYREISAWLKERGVEMDHNQVYRVFHAALVRMALPEHMVRDEEEKAAREDEEKL